MTLEQFLAELDNQAPEFKWEVHAGMLTASHSGRKFTPLQVVALAVTGRLHDKTNLHHLAEVLDMAYQDVLEVAIATSSINMAGQLETSLKQAVGLAP